MLYQVLGIKMIIKKFKINNKIVKKYVELKAKKF